jgi:hypothetical protein
MPKSIQLHQPQNQKHRDVQDDEVIQSNPEAIPQLMLLSSLEGY